jgi:hypothetical protein
MTNTNDPDSVRCVDAPALARLRAPQALQAVLSRKNIEISCILVREDETASYPRLDSLSVRGAQREITSMLVGQGYVPAGRWSDDGEDDDGYREWSRAFKPGQHAGILPF